MYSQYVFEILDQTYHNVLGRSKIGSSMTTAVAAVRALLVGGGEAPEIGGYLTYLYLYIEKFCAQHRGISHILRKVATFSLLKRCTKCITTNVQSIINILAKFKSAFEQIGREYFIGDYVEMQNVILKCVSVDTGLTV